MKEELTIETLENVQIDVDPAKEIEASVLDEQSESIVDSIFALDSRDLEAQREKAVAIRDLGARTQREITRRSALLKQPMTKLVSDAEDGGGVAHALLALQETTDQINPNKFDFSMGTFRRLLSKIPGIGTPISRWFAKYQSVEGVIQSIVESLKDGRSQLERDNTTLKDDQLRMRELTFELQDYTNLGVILDEKISSRLASETNITEDMRKFVEEEILFSLRQRIIDLQQQMAVNQQGVLTTEVIIRNNRELVRGVSRSLNVTITALNIAATLALALETQKRVIKGVEAVNRTTDDLLTQTAHSLSTQGVEIHKQASNAQLDIEKLKKAFLDVKSALDDINSFRRQALPQMDKSIQAMNKLSSEMDESINKLEIGENAQNEILLKFK
jgi:uncharacterized protein YaaN involved in tellurite resistance